MKPRARRINSICIERKHNDRSFNRKLFDKIELCRSICLYINIVELAIMTVVDSDEPLPCILHQNVVNLQEIWISDMNQMRSIPFMRKVFVRTEKVKHPPMVPSPINFTTSHDLYVTTASKRNKIFVVIRVRLFGPVLHIFRCYQFSNDLDSEVVNILNTNGHRVKLWIWNPDNSLLSFWWVCCFYCRQDSICVL